MQGIELLGVIIVAAAALLIFVPIVAEQTVAPPNLLRILIGIGAGMLGAFVVLVLSTDLLPDDVEASARGPLIAVAIIAVLLVVRRSIGR